ncbi:uncharacterized protein PITG_23212 [Phytophthora infestans T30-4]|uniref:Uncharacterized protein n=1 Tax=Phytophthora infestans (strain T30-4) TaxID=403677 RepID=D0P4J8_PHYIT|nr:uncharacterized protein PITG_23212 [Phytophthora infestans T30-4]EEY66869.1 conserved hypothetical protein [Phytophthora infestans T30-4]|eukprot:XP_002894777.1 conserved hypothetical protein [Phytophthora infestans T30-4]
MMWVTLQRAGLRWPSFTSRHPFCVLPVLSACTVLSTVLTRTVVWRAASTVLTQISCAMAILYGVSKAFSNIGIAAL